MRLKTNVFLLVSVLVLAACVFSFLSKPKTETGQTHPVDNSQMAETEQTEQAIEFESEEPEQEETELIVVQETEIAAMQETETTEPEHLAASAQEKKLASMTLEEKVAQMFIITPEALTGYGSVTSAGEATKAALEQYPVGGLIYFAGNIQSEDQVKKMIGGQQQYSRERIGLPLFISVDEEGGKVARIANDSPISVEHFPYMPEIGASEDAIEKARELGDAIGSYLYRLGFNLDFAPVADVLTNPENTVVRERSFGSDPQKAAELVAEVASHLEQQGVYSCLKHFPGHGATTADSHKGYAAVDKTLDELREAELVPFQKGIEAGASFVMVGHISVSKVTGDDTPATLSKTLVTDVLRNGLQFDGIIITDAMNMGAITNKYSSQEAAVRAIEAGVDIILMPVDFQVAYKGVLEAVNSGRISEERIDESVRRILRIKIIT